MAWEDVPGSMRSFGNQMPIGDNEVSIVVTKSKRKRNFRINVPKIAFGKETPKSVLVRFDVKKQRIGIFKAGNSPNARRICTYGPKSRLAYVAVPDIVAKAGFEKGRYKFKKQDNDEIYFIIRAKDRCGEFPTKEELEKETKERLEATDL